MFLKNLINSYKPISTGFPSLDNMLGGFQRGEMYTFMGTAGSGKTAAIRGIMRFIKNKYDIDVPNPEAYEDCDAFLIQPEHKTITCIPEDHSFHTSEFGPLYRASLQFSRLRKLLSIAQESNSVLIVSHQANRNRYYNSDEDKLDFWTPTPTMYMSSVIVTTQSKITEGKVEGTMEIIKNRWGAKGKFKVGFHANENGFYSSEEGLQVEQE